MYNPTKQTIKYSHKAMIISTGILLSFLIYLTFSNKPTNYELVTHILFVYAIFIYICLVTSNFE